MTVLAKKLTREILNFKPTQNYLEKVLQFGEGNFLRAFTDWMIHKLNQSGRLNGKVVVVQPIQHGLIDIINEQQGLYTLILRGIDNGSVVEDREIVTCISRGINPYDNWDDFLRCAENPNLRFIISNTTEAGITYYKEEFNEHKPLLSFPAKVLAFLYHRFKYFRGEPTKGMLIFPCELIDNNGDQLKSIILRLVEAWHFPKEFVAWVNTHNHFFNTLVDRIVTGYPKDESEELEKQLGYKDRLLNVGEIFHLWVIEGDKKFSKELPLADIGMNVIWVDDLSPYRERKVRILNGAHTMVVPVAYLCGLNTVKEAIDDVLVGKFVRAGIFNEILPELQQLSEHEKVSFANSVIERFQNPFIQHLLLDIALNSISKFKTRCLPTLLDYIQHKKQIPHIMSFSLAAHIAFYRGEKVDENKLKVACFNREYFLTDNADVLDFFCVLWKTSEKDLMTLVTKVFENINFWGLDLNAFPGLNKSVYTYLKNIVTYGMVGALENILDQIANCRVGYD